MYLKRYAYPCRYGDLLYHFARPVPELSIITNHMMDLIYGRWHHLLTRYNHDLLSPPGQASPVRPGDRTGRSCP